MPFFVTAVALTICTVFPLQAAENCNEIVPLKYLQCLKCDRAIELEMAELTCRIANNIATQSRDCNGQLKISSN